jgi:hypothetical protein
MYITYAPKAKEKKARRIAGGGSDVRRTKSQTRELMPKAHSSPSCSKMRLTTVRTS